MQGVGGGKKVWGRSDLVFGRLKFEMTITYPSANVT